MNSKEYLTQAVIGELEALFNSIEEADLAALAAEIMAAKRIYFAAAGRSLLTLKGFAMALMQIGFTVYIPGDINTPAIREGDLLIAASCSGKTRITNLFVSCAKQYGARVFLITANAAGEMAAMADRVMCLAIAGGRGGQWGGNDFEVALMPIGDSVIHAICQKTGATEATMRENHANIE